MPRPSASRPASYLYILGGSEKDKNDCEYEYHRNGWAALEGEFCMRGVLLVFQCSRRALAIAFCLSESFIEPRYLKLYLSQTLTNTQTAL